jgi:7-carboxy-7-deazaguanine synthase
MEQDKSRMLPIAEDFHSLQGEGRWTGTPMHFVRLAGCSVGQPQPGYAYFDQGDDVDKITWLKTGAKAWQCCTYDGRPFWCDTDFNLHHWVSFDDLFNNTGERHICLTGGEPLIHMEKVLTFLEEATERGIMTHIETSGTINFIPIGVDVWISVSPKLNVLPKMLEIADEVKLLVDENFDLAKLPLNINNCPLVYVQPINDELSLNKANFDRCMEMLRIMPHWHMSVQMHKLLGLR